MNGLQPWLRDYAVYLVSWVQHYWPEVKVSSTFRSRTEQLRLWNNRANNPYPVAPPGTSKHELGRAFDLVGPPAALAWAGRLWEQMGGTWGGRFGHADPIHFEA